MRRLVVNLPNTLDEWLKGEKNQNETVRKALEIYHGDITTDTLGGMRQAFRILQKDMKEMQERFVELYEMTESTHRSIEEIKNR